MDNREDDPMNQDVFAGQWKQMRGELRSWWGKLTDADFDRIGGQKDKLIGLVQEKYGYIRDQAQREVERRFQEYETKMSSARGSGSQHAATATAGKSANTSDDGLIATATTAVADGLESAQGAIATGLESAQGAISSAATAVTGGVESATSYLQEKKFDEMANDLTTVIRTYPVQSLLVGIGLGYMLARLTR
jgi:uncharacterized protein YjbJ (UPF0337 family)